MKKETKTILLVEDQTIVAMAESRTLNNLGYDVVISGSGEDAVTLMKADHIIDLILMDIDLGRGMSGLEAAEIILKSHNIPVVFLSSHEEPEIIRQAGQISKYGYIVKIPAPSVLQSSIEKAFCIFEGGS